MKTPLKSDPPRVGLNGVFVIKSSIYSFSRSHFVFIIWTENRKSANLKLKNLKTNNYEPVSLFALAHKSASFKAYSSSFCSGVLYCNLRFGRSNLYSKLTKIFCIAFLPSACHAFRKKVKNRILSAICYFSLIK